MIVNREPKYKGYLNIDELTVKTKKGKEIKREVMRRKNAVAALVYNTVTQKYIFVSQFRPGTGGDIIEIPAGVLDGQKIKLRGKGATSPNGGPNGDLVITITVKPHPVFSRDGNNLRLTVPVTFAEAVLGATISVPTLGGDPVKLKVAPNTPNGRVLRVKGKGVTTAKGVGDLLASVEVLVPSHISDKAAKALAEFDELLPKEDPRADLLNKAGLL